MIKIDVLLIITFSKLMAFLVLVVGSIFSFITKDSTVLLTTISTVVVMLGFKQYQDRIKNKDNSINKTDE